MTELVRARNDRDAHGPVLVRALRPHLRPLFIDPHREAHIDYYGAGASS